MDGDVFKIVKHDQNNEPNSYHNKPQAARCGNITHIVSTSSFDWTTFDVRAQKCWAQKCYNWAVQVHACEKVAQSIPARDVEADENIV